ncbi:TonB-dependent receptor family protein [Phyllobacterium endophyticum]|uniref:TonB-dependent receptor family protein n=1 Tax=Phyllobacterium endophyticum TaxID=1149773 RepID=UPI0017E412C6|nr:TonB-dependent siderophore receptor [Phyllobacterium endophyticum]MBB3238046.1 Fe(3+) dicitrate transport protein [Phyllobacterium endophyticum]
MHKTYLAIALALFSSTTSSHAQESALEGTSILLDTITITGNWLDQPNAEKVLKHPGARTIIDRKQFEEGGASNIRDVLRMVPGVQVQDSNGTGGSDVSLNLGVRGLASRLSPRSTVLMDGVPLSYAPYGQPQLSLFPLTSGNIEAVDVVRGAGSVRYGPQNVGGIINFVTRPIPEDFSAEVSSGADIVGGNGNVKATPNFFIGGTHDSGYGGAILYSGIHGKGYRDGNDKSDIDDIILKGAYEFSDTDKLAIQFHHYEGGGRMPGGLTAKEYAEDPYQSKRRYDEFTGRRDDISLRYQHDDGENNFELLTYYVDSFRGSHVEQQGTGANANRYRLNAAPRDYEYFGIEPRYSRLFETGPVTQEVTIGYRYLREESSETASRTAFYDRSSGIDPNDLAQGIYQTSKGGTTAHAVYIDDKIEIGKWTVTPGIRYEMIDTHNNVTDFNNGNVTRAITPEIDASEALPTISLAYKVDGSWTLFANAGVSFGPQQYSHLASTTEGLHPEKATTYEVGTHYLGENWSAELTVFNIDFDEELFLGRSVFGEGVWTNLGATQHRGVEFAGRYDLSDLSPALDGLSLSATYTYTDATYEAGAFEGRDLPLYSHHVGSIGARYQYDDWVLNADILAQSKQHAPGNAVEGATYVTEEDSTGRYGDIPGYATVNMRLAYQPEGKKHAPKLAFGVKNLFDKEYFTRAIDNNGGKFVGQARTFFVSASVAF